MRVRLKSLASYRRRLILELLNSSKLNLGRLFFAQLGLLVSCRNCLMLCVVQINFMICTCTLSTEAGDLTGGVEIY